jgi:diguanylate cyclase (GGDEF)-like protein/PAS domain S-box-containing protein
MAELTGRGRRFLARTPVAAVLVDRRGRGMVANARAEQLLGLEPDGIVGLDCFELIKPDDRDRAARNLADAASRDLPSGVRMRTEARHSSGRWIDVRAVAVNLLDQDGFGGVLVSLRPADPATEPDPVRRGWFEAVVSGTDDVVEVLDEDGRILWASGPVESLLGLPADVLVGLKLEQLPQDIDARDVTRWFERLKDASAAGPVLQRTRRTFGGRTRDLEVRMNNLLDDPEVGALVMTTRDITMQVALARSDAQWLAVSKHAHELVARIDESSVVQWAGPGFETLLGIDPESLVGTSVRDLVHPDDRARPGGLEDLVRDDRTGYNREYRLRHGDGSWRVFDVQVADLRHEPSVGAFLVTARDVTDRVEAEEANRRLATAIESAGAAVIITDTDGKILSWNREAERLSGRKASQVVGRSLERSNPVPRNRRAQFRESMLSGATITYETDRLVREGRRVTLSVTASPITDAAGTVTGFSFIGFDVTEQRDAAREREARVAQARALAELGQRALSGASVPDVLQDACERTAATMGVEHVQVLLHAPGTASLELAAAVGGLAEQVGRTELLDLRGWLAAADEPRRAVGIDDFGADGAPERPFGVEAPGVRSGALCAVDGRDGSIGYLLALHDDVRTFGDAELAFLQSIANVLGSAVDRARVSDEMQRRALHDELTGLPNRALLIDRLTQAVGRLERRPGTAVGLLFIDLDRFKRVNDTLGHQAGDDVLVATAGRLLDAVRSGDTVARTGGDEFLVLTEELLDPIGAIALADRIAASIAEPVLVDGHGLHVTASIGIALAGAATDPEELVRDADLAMYRAKQDGRDRIQLFDASMRDEAISGMAMEEALRAAVSSRAVRVVFQPQVDMVDGSLQGIEALARWDHPRLGEVPPSDFVAVAEDIGVLDEITRAVLAATCDTAASLLATHPDVSAAVNLTPRQLSRRRILELVDEALHTAGLPPEALVVEVTETAALDDPVSLKILGELRDRGVRVSIDDFGTGYSSLARVTHLPVDEVKIDRSFVTGVAEDRGCAAAVSAIVTLARVMGLRLVAEGVEAPHQQQALVELGCEEGQGWLFAGPLARDELMAWVATRSGGGPTP